MTAPKTRQDYEREGRADARAGRGRNERFERGSSSWQAVAYWVGYDSVPPQPAQGLMASINVEDAAATTHGWPRAAREHSLRLIKDHNKEKNASRRERLNRAWNRMQARWRGRTEMAHCLDFPISTQPHPDGPITVGQLLRGE